MTVAELAALLQISNKELYQLAHCENFWTQLLSIRGQTHLRLAFSVR